ncbi:VUT family protein [Rhodococcus pyridinivorans]|uniref:VUT family protein n=1 Tax=Rhodococcus pyridinivorans TaxID=103816 RepID=UPI001FFF3376|nr:VUT family protein [Rhodococcus pyridinivorans]UPK63587.1 VUT family protein [Rhodococcus pyridinivorans]
MTNTVRVIGYAAAVGVVGSVILSNWLTTRYGFIPVGFGQEATAGTLAAGAALALRDAVQDALGKAGMLVAVVIATILSYFVSAPSIAIASAAAFFLAELLNFLIYTPLRHRSRLGDRRWAAAVTSSSIAGALVDTAVFLGIAFGAAAIMPALLGQLIGKAWATILYLVLGRSVAHRLTKRTTRVDETVQAHQAPSTPN